MATTKKNATQTPAPAKTAEQIAVDKARNILMQADLYRRNYEKARDEFLARAQDNPADAIAWNGEAATIATVQYAQVAHYGLLLGEAEMASILSNQPVFSITPAEVIERATKTVRYLARQLLGRSVGRSSSTGHFHNAVDGATAEAYSRTVRDLAHYCTAMNVDELVYA
ncbi:MAG: hypothetical protein BIFFINMI_03789 [Phycisphaerae bacterium]|nr:hypothetical protein [Phycisphaerae bacterium]